MTTAIHTGIFKILRSMHELHVYFANKVETIQLRIPSITSLNGTSAAIMLFPGKSTTPERFVVDGSLR